MVVKISKELLNHQQMEHILIMSVAMNRYLNSFKKEYKEFLEDTNAQLVYEQTLNTFVLEVLYTKEIKRVAIPFYFKGVPIIVKPTNRKYKTIKKEGKLMNIDTSQHILVTPTNVVLNKDEPVVLYKYDGSILNIPANEQVELNLTEYKGIQTTDFRIALTNHSPKKIDEIKEDPKAVRALYYFMGFEINNWTGAEELDELAFFDRMSRDDYEGPKEEIIFL